MFTLSLMYTPGGKITGTATLTVFEILDGKDLVVSGYLYFVG